MLIKIMNFSIRASLFYFQYMSTIRIYALPEERCEHKND